MFTALLSGIILGFLVSTPPLGPVFFAVMTKGLKGETHKGLFLGIGAAVTDTFYALIAVTGISLISSQLPESITNYYEVNEQLITTVFTYASGLFVFMYGIKIILHKQPDIPKEKMDEENLNELSVQPRQKGLSFFSTFERFTPHISKQIITGATLAFSSLTLPASWFAIVGVLKSHYLIEKSYASGILFCTGVFIGTYLWFFTMLKIIAHNKHRIGSSTLRYLYFGSGVVLNILGLTLLFHAYQMPGTNLNLSF